MTFPPEFQQLVNEMASAQGLHSRSPVEKLIYNEDYVRGVLGIDIPLNESYPYSLELQERILEEHLLFEGFFSDFKKLSGDAKNLALAMRYMMEDSSRISDFVSAAYETVIKEPLEKISGFIEKISTVLKDLFEKFALPKVQSVWSKLKEVIVAFGEKLQGAWDKIQGMSGWKQALVVMGFGTALGYLWSEQGIGDIVETADGVLEGIGELIPKAVAKLSSITDKLDGEETKNVLSLAKESALPTMTYFLHEELSTSDKVEKADKATDAAGKASEIAGKLGGDELDLIGKVKKEIMKQIEPLFKVVKEKVVDAFKNIVKQIGADALLGLASGGVSTFISGIKKAFGGMKLVSKLFGGTLGKFVDKIKNPEKEAEEAEKGEDDPTDDSTKKEEKKESISRDELILREYIRERLMAS
tara:strand:- start:1338 stop:2582 length:1245 start_codon:yes stop_codon:yes gene_type:complete